MEAYEILVEILKNPDAPKFYRKLQNYYKTMNMHNESEAILNLIEIRFEKNVSNN